jgi:hypothetical protein
MRRLTRAEWEAIPKCYRSVVHGVRHRLTMDERGITILEPVQVIHEKEIGPQMDFTPKLMGQDELDI